MHGKILEVYVKEPEQWPTVSSVYCSVIPSRIRIDCKLLEGRMATKDYV